MVKLLINALILSIRPLLGPAGTCRFELPCSDYARMQLHDKSLWRAFYNISIRVISCNPLSQFLLALFNKR